MELKASSLGLNEKQLKYRMDKNDSFTEQDMDAILRLRPFNQQGINMIKVLVGKPLSEAVHGDCGLFHIKSGESHETTPATHIPTLAGTIAAAQFVLRDLDISDITEARLVESVAEFNVFGYPSLNSIQTKMRVKNCVCNDDVYQEAYRNIWNIDN
jgi:hypothetical protein